MKPTEILQVKCRKLHHATTLPFAIKEYTGHINTTLLGIQTVLMPHIDRLFVLQYVKRMELTITHIPPVHVIRMSGRWDAFSAPKFEQFCAGLTGTEQMRFAVLDMTDVDYISSFGLRALLHLGKRLEGLGGAVRIAGMRPGVYKVFSGSGFDSLFHTFTDVDAARTYNAVDKEIIFRAT